MGTPKVGNKAPVFKGICTGEGSVDLSKLKGKKVVLYFYPKDSTPGCTTEGQNFRDLYKAFKKEGALIFGLSRESLKSHENFKSKQSIQLKSITGKTFNGTITSVQGSQLSISLDSTQRGLRPGIQAFAILVKNQQILDGAATTIKIKRDKYVMKDGGANPIRTAVTGGMQNEIEAVVRSGLKENERVRLQRRKAGGGGSPWGEK